jgi:AcrR family transcriptional regulator
MTKADRRSQLLANARRVFGELGYSGATMEEIAARSGVARSLLYEHFDSLDELYLECVHDARSELAGHVMAAANVPGGPEDRLRAGVQAYLTFVKDEGRGWDVLFARTAEQIAALLMAELPRLPPSEAHAYAHAITGAGEQLARWWRYNPDVPLDTVVERMMTIVWGGMQGVVDELGDPER